MVIELCCEDFFYVDFKSDDDCVSRVIEPGAIVCVCNSTYCDSVQDVEVKENQYVTYTSTKKGKRLQRSIGNFSSQPISNEIILTVDITQRYQKIFGFGGAMTDAAALNIRTLSNETQQKLLESYYSDKGSEYVFCRIPIAGTDFSTRPYTYDDVPDDFTLSHFHLAKEDDYKMDYLNKMKSVMSKPGNLKIFTTAWSAPPWMKNTDDIKWGALKFEYYQRYADYICKFLDAYNETGIKMWGITTGNEPFNGIWPFFPFNSMFWSSKTGAIFSANYLAPTLAKAGYNLVYMTLDDQRYGTPWYPKKVFENEKAKKLFSGTAVHWYADTFISPLRLDELHDMYPDKFILMTEACTGSTLFEEHKVILGCWLRGEQYLSDIIESLSHWITGWVDWNLALNKSGGPNWANNFVDAPIIVMPENDEFYKQPMYYALYHVSKFVSPNSTRIGCTGLGTDMSDLVQAIAFSTPENNIVLVLLNKDEKSYDIAIQDKAIPGKHINLQLPAKSFTTLKYKAKT
ncbi:glucosylceramidase isoform X2 [Harpegnathos saltator]|uniref:glucosylceramidase isoform X2 n=1 Tax=Harpegnathos saltator TaxID=610380 RepID=UPI000948A774|nr:glucosylceramidase isoform X2 [Harpegnathos saltator]